MAKIKFTGTPKTLFDLYREGLTWKKIGEMFGISKQRAHEIAYGYRSYKGGRKGGERVTKYHHVQGK